MVLCLWRRRSLHNDAFFQTIQALLRHWMNSEAEPLAWPMALGSAHRSRSLSILSADMPSAGAMGEKQ